MDAVALAASLDQTLLKPTAGFSEAQTWIDDNADLGFASLCVSPFLVPIAALRLTGTKTAVCSVAGFPLGYVLTQSKAQEALDLLQHGCTEVDMVVNFAALIDGDYDYVRDDVRAVVDAVATASGGSAFVKVILETGHLNDELIQRGCELAVEAGAAYVKTSTGFGPRGASVDDVALMRRTVGPEIGVKAAGGIRDLDTALAMLAAGASRIGTSAGIEILTEAAGRG